MISTGLLGFGYWGANLARNVATHGGYELTWIADPSESSALRARSMYPGTRIAPSADQVLADARTDLVIVATPLNSHYELALAALEANKHVLLTKPMVTSTEQADRLCEIAQAKGLTLMVDHTFVFSEPVRKMCEIAGKGLIGELLYFTSIRVNLGTFRRDANVVWDLAPHDLSIIQCLSGRSPVAVLATGGLEMGSGVCQTAHLTVYYLPDVMAHITVSWLSPVKVRLMLIGGARQMMVYNDLEADERVKVYDRSVEVTAGAELPTGGASFEGVVEYRVGDMWAPNIGRGEALFAELDHLATCLASGDEPLTSGSRSREIVATLAAADRSLSRHGELQILDASGWSLWSGRVSDRA